MAGLVLSRHDINPHKLANHSKTPLRSAACSAHKGVMRPLHVPDDVKPDKADHDSQTALLEASMFGHKGVLRLLLVPDDINLHKLANNNKTALSDDHWGSEKPSSVRAPKLHLAATVAKSISSGISLILLAIIVYLLQLPVAMPRVK